MVDSGRVVEGSVVVGAVVVVGSVVGRRVVLAVVGAVVVGFALTVTLKDVVRLPYETVIFFVPLLSRAEGEHEKPLATVSLVPSSKVTLILSPDVSSVSPT